MRMQTRRLCGCTHASTLPTATSYQVFRETRPQRFLPHLTGHQDSAKAAVRASCQLQPAPESQPVTTVAPAGTDTDTAAARHSTLQVHGDAGLQTIW
jgi:hypothetical protein